MLPDRSCIPVCLPNAAASACARVSFHKIHGRSTSPRLSKTVTPCICPATPIPLSSANKGEQIRISSTALSSASTHSRGPCSDHPSWGGRSYVRQKRQGDLRRRPAKPEGPKFPSQRLSNSRFLYLLQISRTGYQRPHLGFQLYRRSASRCFRPLCAMPFQTCPDQATFA